MGRICLIPLRTEPRSPEENWRRLEECLAEAASQRPDLVCLPECTLTGYLDSRDDLARFAEPVPGPTLVRMASLARHHAAYLCFGLLEQTEAGVYYDTALLLDRAGELVLRHRKICERAPFSAGDVVACAATGLGRLGLLICGDLFDERAVSRLDAALDLLVVPMSRSFAGRSPDRERWLAGERLAYVDAARRTGVPVALVNALETGVEEPAFGGALVVLAGGAAAESPHGTDDLLFFDLSSLRRGG